MNKSIGNKRIENSISEKGEMHTRTHTKWLKYSARFVKTQVSTLEFPNDMHKIHLHFCEKV